MKRNKVSGNQVGARTVAYLRGQRDLFIKRRKSEQALLTDSLPFPDEPPIGRCPHCGQEFDITRGEAGYHFEFLRESKDWRKARYRHKACGGVVVIRSWVDD